MPKEIVPLQVDARAPFHVFYEGPALRVSATNKIGQFDILPGHADFFSVLKPGPVTIETADDVISFTLSNGIAAVHDNQVMLFVNI